MADVEDVEHEVKPTVRFPAFRREVILAVAAFSDVDYQRRVWVDGIMPFEGYGDSLTENVHALYDDFLDLPHVDDAIGEILVDGPEVEALVAFDRAFRPILDELGDAPDIDYLAHPSWGVVVQRAQRALSAMVLANAV